MNIWQVNGCAFDSYENAISNYATYSHTIFVLYSGDMGLLCGVR